MANSVDADKTPRSVASDVGLYCLPMPVCPNSKDYYSISRSVLIFDQYCLPMPVCPNSKDYYSISRSVLIFDWQPYFRLWACP